MIMRKKGIATKKKNLTVCVRLFLEQGYKNNFPLDHKINRFLTVAMWMYKMPEEAQQRVLAFVAGLDIMAMATM